MGGEGRGGWSQGLKYNVKMYPTLYEKSIKTGISNQKLYKKGTAIQKSYTRTDSAILINQTDDI